MHRKRVRLNSFGFLILIIYEEGVLKWQKLGNSRKDVGSTQAAMEDHAKVGDLFRNVLFSGSFAIIESKYLLLESMILNQRSVLQRACDDVVL